MTKTPIDLLLDRVDWKAEEGDISDDDSLPYATHSGVLSIPLPDGRNLELRCYRLNDGRAIINAEDFEDFLFGFGLMGPKEE